MCKKADVDMVKRAGELSEEEVRERERERETEDNTTT